MVLVVLERVLAFADRIVEVVIAVAARALVLSDVVHVVVRLGLERGLSLVFQFLFRFQSMLFFFFDALFHLFLLQQKVHNVESHGLVALLVGALDDLLAVLLGDLL